MTLCFRPGYMSQNSRQQSLPSPAGLPHRRVASVLCKGGTSCLYPKVPRWPLTKDHFNCRKERA